MFHNFVSQFQYQPLRDLAWVLNSPHLLSERTGVACAKEIHRDDDAKNEWLLALDKQPEALLSYCSQTNHQRLGGYFEALLKFTLQQSSDVALLLNNWVVRDGKETLGECDFIFRDLRRQQIHHWEVTVKFYLYHQGHFFGTNVRDRLDIKYRRLRDHQLKLPQRPLVKALLKNQFGIEQLDSSVFFKGYLFYPLGFEGDQSNMLADDHLRGSWCHLPQLAEWCGRQALDCRYCMVPRLQWLSACFRKDESGVLDFLALSQVLSECFQLRPQGQLVVALKQGDYGWCEVARCMVVEEGWPVV